MSHEISPPEMGPFRLDFIRPIKTQGLQGKGHQLSVLVSHGPFPPLVSGYIPTLPALAPSQACASWASRNVGTEMAHKPVPGTGMDLSYQACFCTERRKLFTFLPFASNVIKNNEE